MNDSLIVAEASLIGATILLSSDVHITSLDHTRLKLVLDSADVSTPLVASPRDIVRQFF